MKFFCLFATILLSLLYGENEPSFATLEEEYTPKYCLQLETAYGEGMMSEGGADAIEHMFDQVLLTEKRALDIGSGLGGVAIYLADKHGMHVTGLDVNPWMIEESVRRIPEKLKEKVDFFLSKSNFRWPLEDKHFDLIYSKGVLTHIEKKDATFQECHRLLKEDGLLVITDWLSSEERKWGEHVARLVELEGLALYPESESGYIETLERNGFSVISVRDDSLYYYQCNLDIIKRLKILRLQKIYLEHFSSAEISAAIEGYEAIAEALKSGEIRTLRFIAQRL